MWKHFVKSMGLLTIALMAALYSSSAGRDGRITVAVLSALLALGVATWVCWRFVPQLVRGVDWDWIPLFSQYRITREGWIYFGGILIVVFAALNTNNNLLYMVLSALLAVLLLSGFLSALNFRFLKLDLRLPSHCFAREPFAFTLQLSNRKHVFPAFSLKIAPATPDTWIRFRHFYFAVVQPQSHIVQPGQAAFARRGRYVVSQVKTLSRFPFGFLSRERHYPVEAECMCYPEIMPQDGINFSVLDLQGSTQRFERGLGTDLYRIRDYVPSDSARHVHWKASAKTASLKTREYAAEESRRIILAFDRFGRAEDAEAFERLVSYAASLAFYLMQDGTEIAFVSDDWVTSFGSSDIVLSSILSYLALVEMSEAAVTPDVNTDSAALLLSLRRKQG